MTPLVFWFDVVSPYAWLAFDRLPQALEGLSYAVEYRPLLFAGLLAQGGQKGPAEIAPKRAWTYRQVAWLAAQQGTTLQVPRPHPFNPLALLRLALASAPAGQMPNRRVVECLFRHAWCADGADADDAGRWAELLATVAPVRDPQGSEVKAELRALTERAWREGVFGVPSLQLGARVFWGQDALPMLRAALTGDPWFAGPAWDAAGAQPPGLQRAP